MSTVATVYNRYSYLTEDQYAAGRIAYEKFRTGSGIVGETGTKASDQVAFSDQGRRLAASSTRAREEMEALTYEPLLEFAADDGSTVSVGMSREGEGDEARYSAVRVTITRQDGSEESLYFSFDVTQAENSEKTGPEDSAVEAAGTDAGDSAPAQTGEEAVPSLMELVEQYGLNKTGNPGEGLLDAIRQRIEAMIEASEETAEENEAMEQVKSERAARNEAAGGTATADDAGTKTPALSVSSDTGTAPAGGYTRRGSAASAIASPASFSRHY